MARLIGVDLPREKRTEIGLTYIFGIGRTRAAETLAATGISGDIRVHQLTDEQLRDAGIAPGTIRLSVGTEHIDDILADLEHGFEAVKE